MDEQRLLEQLKGRNEIALEEAVSVYEAYISAIVFRIIGSAMAREDLQEVVNDTFYSLWVNAERIDLDKGSLRAYLAAIARNKAKNKLREHKTQTLLIQETDQVEVTDFCLGLEKEERAKILKDALDMLKRDEREITKLMRARKKLKIHLRERGICQ